MENQVCFIEGQYMHQFFNYNIMKFWLKINGGSDRRPNYAIMAVSNSNYASAKTLGSREALHPPAIMNNSYSHFCSLIHPVSKFYLK